MRIVSTSSTASQVKERPYSTSVNVSSPTCVLTGAETVAAKDTVMVSLPSDTSKDVSLLKKFAGVLNGTIFACGDAKMASLISFVLRLIFAPFLTARSARRLGLYMSLLLSCQ